MNKTTGRIIFLLVAIAIAGGSGYLLGHRSAGGEEKADAEATTSTAPAEEDKPVMDVTTVPLKISPIEETTTVYGSIAAEPGNLRVLSVPFESRVVRVVVTPGEQVANGAAVVQVEGSPDALLALQDAKNAVAAATLDLKQVEQRLADHLATNQELATAKQTLQSGQLKLDSLTQRGVGEPKSLAADGDGVISKVDVQEGQIVPAGGALVEIAEANRIEAHLGVQPDDAMAIKPGQTIRLYAVGKSPAEAVEGKVRLVSQRVDPATRLVSVSVSLPADSHFMLDTYVAGEIVRGSANAMTVPHDAALPEEDGSFVLYTVKDKHAVKHKVTLGLQDDKNVQITGEGLTEGDDVVVVGNYQLEDGMEVETKEAAAEPTTVPTTAPSTEPAAPATVPAEVKS